MIFTCPTCSIEINVNRFPVECCRIAHAEHSTAIREGEIVRAKRKKVIAPASDLLAPCVFRSKKSRRQWCDPCNKFLLIYDCDHFGCECAIGKTIVGIRSCNGCEEKAPPLNPAVGVITAHRKEPTLARTLSSLRSAGWSDVHVFDDGGSSTESESITTRKPPSGAWSNWWLALQELAIRNPDAKYFLLCEDDGLMAAGARNHVEQLDAIKTECVISLYLSARYDYTETTRFLGGKTFTGAVALLITRPALDRMISTRLGLSHRRQPHRNNDLIDGAVGQWCRDHDVPLWVLSPGLVQHIGVTSTLGHAEKPSRNVVSDVRDIGRNHAGTNIGLIGWNTASGLGTLNRAIAKYLQPATWLITNHPDFDLLPDIPCVQAVHARRPVPNNIFAEFISQLDVLMFCEQPAVLSRPDVLIEAKRRGVKVACVPMIEYLDDERWQTKIGDWPSLVDLFLCPTRQCFEMMGVHRDRAVYYPWPIDLGEIAFRERKRVEAFVFYHGTGGHGDRKGAEIVAAAARLAPDVPMIVYSQAHDGMRSHRFELPDWPSHVEVRGHQVSRSDLYRDGDVCIQPSRWEGLGLQLIECQAAGMPLVTTDGEPMREYQPFRTINSLQGTVRVHRDVPRYDANPEDLARIMRELHGHDISEASAASRRFAESRDWAQHAEPIKRLLTPALPAASS